MTLLFGKSKTNKYLKNNFGQLHCDDGPAYIDNNVIEYWINGKLHREDGPARI